MELKSLIEERKQETTGAIEVTFADNDSNKD